MERILSLNLCQQIMTGTGMLFTMVMAICFGDAGAFSLDSLRIIPTANMTIETMIDGQTSKKDFHAQPSNNCEPIST